MPLIMEPGKLRALYAAPPPDESITKALYGANITTIDQLLDALDKITTVAPDIALHGYSQIWPFLATQNATLTERFATVRHIAQLELAATGRINSRIRIGRDLYRQNARHTHLTLPLQANTNRDDDPQQNRWTPLLRSLLRANVIGTRDYLGLHLAAQLIAVLDGLDNAPADLRDALLTAFDPFHRRDPDQPDFSTRLPEAWAAYHLYPRLEPEPDTGRFKVSYYADRDKCQRDIRTSTTLQRFCCRMLGLDERQANTIRDLAVQHLLPQDAVATRLEIATTIADIEWVYRNGPSSCMNSRNFFPHLGGDGPMVTADTNEKVRSPVACYASPNLGVAFIRDPDNDDRVVARAVVNRRDKLWARTYGDVELMITTLQSAGYNHDRDALAGCHIRHIVASEDDDIWAQPYLDWADADCGRKDAYGHIASRSWGSCTASERITQLDGMAVRRVHESANSSGSYTNYETGYANGHKADEDEDEDEDRQDTFFCECCETDYHDDNYGTNEVYVEHPTDPRLILRSITLCEECLRNNYSLCNDIYIHDDYVIPIDGEYYWRYDSEITQCPRCNNYGLTDDTMTVLANPDAHDDAHSETEEWCSRCADRYTTACNTTLDDDEVMHVDDAIRPPYDDLTGCYYTPAAYARLRIERDTDTDTPEATTHEQKEPHCEAPSDASLDNGTVPPLPFDAPLDTPPAHGPTPDAARVDLALAVGA